MLKLVVASKDYLDQVKIIVDEFKTVDNVEIIPGSGQVEAYLDDLNLWVEKHDWFRKGVDLDHRYVPCTQFLLLDNDDVVGFFSMRHDLNDHLRNIGGHIGYSIRPSARRKGYASEGLKLCLNELKKLGVEEALVTCSSTNEASKKTILKCGGVFEGSSKVDAEIIERYIIKI